MRKSSKYTLDWDKKKIKQLQGQFAPYVTRTRAGFLPTEAKKRLLYLTHWKEGTTDQEVYQFFYDIRERSLAAMKDFQLLCQRLNEEQLEMIFARKDVFSIIDSKKKITSTTYPITELMKSLIPHPLFARPQSKEFMKQLMKQREWRKQFLQDLVVESLLWFFHSGIFKTDEQKKLLFDAIDAITVNTSGEKSFELRHNEWGMNIVKF